MTDVIEQYREFARVWPWLEEGLKASPLETHRKEHVWAAIEKGDCQLWSNPTAAAVTEITVYPTGLRAVNVWIAGGDLDGIRDIDARIDEFAKMKNCPMRTIHGRKGWSRVLTGYREVGAILFKELA